MKFFWLWYYEIRLRFDIWKHRRSKAGKHHVATALRHRRELLRDYEPEQKWGSHHDYKEHLRYGGTRDDY